jgi:hypothetical protein
MKYAIEQRLRLIDFLVANYGHIRRAMIMDYFGVSMPQASMDIQEYIKLAPHNLQYDKSNKVYIKTDQFVRVWE